MRKNLPLYILLTFLIIVNVFFLYNYLGNDKIVSHKEPKNPREFLVKELGFDATQQKQLTTIDVKHHQRMQSVTQDIKSLKDELFRGLSDRTLNVVNVDSIAKLIGEKQAIKDLEVFHHFKQVQDLCNDKQQEIFTRIIKDALRGGDREQGPPPGARPDENRPPRPEGRNGDRPPHPDGPDGNRPPPPEH